MSKTISVEVTAEDIAYGQADATLCPVALAIRRATGKAVAVDAYEADIGDGRALLPPEVTHFVLAFDRGDEVEPFRFNLAADGGES